MKKVVSFVLVLALVLGSFGMVFAATDNSVNRVTTVAPDSDIPTVTLVLKVKNTNFIEDDQQFKLSLTNATWAQDPVSRSTIVTTGAVTTAAIGPSISVTNAGITTVSAVAATSKTAEIRIEGTASLAKDEEIVVQLALVAGSDEGEVKVALDAVDSELTSGSYTVAVVGSGKTSATVVDDPGQTWRGPYTGNTIEIRENSVNSVTTNQSLKISLPKGVTWDTMNPAVDFGGTMGTIANVDYANGDRDLTFDIVYAGADNQRDLLTITPNVIVGKDASLGDIAVTIRNMTTGADKEISNVSNLIIGKYVEESVDVYTVKEKDIPEFVAGRVDSEYTIEVTVEELIDSALASQRFIDFELPEYVQLTSDEAIHVKATGSLSFDLDADALGGTQGSFDYAKGDQTEDTSSLEYTLPAGLDNTKTDKYVFTIPVTVEAGTPTGDLKIKISGAKAGITDTELVVAKILNPITVEPVLTDIRTGVQNQALGNIVIKEAFEGAIMDNNGDKIVVTIADIKGKLKDVDVEVTDGNLEIGKITTDVNANDEPIINIPVKNGSVTKASEITIKNATLTVDRTPAEGKYQVEVGGSALVENANHNDGDFSGTAAKADYLKVVTPANQGVNAKFVIGETKYVTNGTEVTMDAASYIDASGRTMVPIRHIANALGVSDNQIVWNQATKTATIFGNNTVVITVGQSQLTVNGAVVPMDTVAVNNNGRIFVPARYIANALGAAVDWDAATKTVSIFTVK